MTRRRQDVAEPQFIVTKVAELVRSGAFRHMATAGGLTFDLVFSGCERNHLAEIAARGVRSCPRHVIDIEPGD